MKNIFNFFIPILIFSGIISCDVIPENIMIPIHH